MQDLKDLISRAQAGDLEAFDIIIQRFRDMAVGYAYSILGDFHLAEDAAQEAFVQTYKDLCQLRQPQAFPAWFRRIVFKYCDRILRRNKHPTLPLDKTPEPTDPSQAPPDKVQKREDQDAVLNSIQSLPQQERLAASLFYINGYSYAEVGDFLEMPLGTVKSSLHSARKKLKERMVEMVEKTLKKHAPGDEFNKRIRKVLDKVPRVSFQLHQKKDKSGLCRCPESIPFPSCLRSCLEYIGDDLGSKPITVQNRDWRLDTTYVYLMGTTGAAFRLSWKPDWYMGNPSMALIYEDPLAPYRYGLESVGYTYEIVQEGDSQFNEKYLKEVIIASIQEKGRPVIANGVVGPPVDCLVSGFDDGGDVLIGWSYFQTSKEFSADVEFEPGGYFRKRNWFPDIHLLVLLQHKAAAVPWAEIYRDSLRRAVEIIRTPIVQGDCHSGLTAYSAWADAIQQDDEFAQKKVKELHHRYHIHMDATGIIAEGRWYAYQFLQKVMEDVPCPQHELSQAAACFDAEHSLIWEIWDLVGGPGASVKKAKLFKDSGIRKKTAEIIIRAREKDKEAADHLEQALKKW